MKAQQKENENLVSENTRAENVEGDESSDSENKDKKVVPSSNQQEENDKGRENDNIVDLVEENIEKNEEITPDDINPKIE